VQLEAIRMDPRFAGGEYYDAADGEGPHRGLALARRMALLNYRSPVELNQRFQRSWQSDVSPLGHGGRFAVESYLDFHGNKFTRRFDANSYLTLVEAMNSHDVGRDRGGVEDALARVTARPRARHRQRPPVPRRRAAPHLPRHPLDDRRGDRRAPSDFGHDGFLIETDAVGIHLRGFSRAEHQARGRTRAAEQRAYERTSACAALPRERLAEARHRDDEARRREDRADPDGATKPRPAAITAPPRAAPSRCRC
jgi:homoserine O-acetyltransferase